MAEITLTAQQIYNMGLWSEVCKYKGWDYLSFDRVRPDERITFDDKFEKPEDKELNINKNFIVIGSVLKEKYKVEDVIFQTEEYNEAPEYIDLEQLDDDKWYEIINTGSHIIEINEIQHVKTVDELEEWI